MSDTRKILITGANSFIGTFFKDNANSYDVEEVCLQENEVSDIDFSSYDTVFHVAALVHQTSKVPTSVYFQVNTDLAFDVAKAAKEQGVKQFVFMSTVKVFGENSDERAPWTEDTECNPSDAYGKSKLAAERLLNDLNDKDFVVSIIRTPVVYGANVKGNIEKMAKYIMRSHIIPLNGIKNKRAMVFIGNLVPMLYRIIDLRAAGLFLAGDRRAISTSDFARFMIDASGKRKLFITIPNIVQVLVKKLTPGIHQRLLGSMVIDNSKTFKALDYYPPYTVEEGLEDVMGSLTGFELKTMFFNF